MNCKLSRIFIALLATAMMDACTSVPERVTLAPPQVEFDTPASLAVALNEPVEFKARITAGDRVSGSWYVDGNLEASSATFRYVFTQAGNHTVRYTARNGSGEVTRDFAVAVADALQVRLSIGDSLRITRRLGDTLRIMAITDAGNNITHNWTVDGGASSYSGEYLHTLTLAEKREYAVRYDASNSAGTRQQSFVVNVIDRALKVIFSESQTNLVKTMGATLSISATVVVGGSEGVTHTWKVDDAVMAHSAQLHYVCSVPGNHTVTYRGVNSRNERVEKTYSLFVKNGLSIAEFNAAGLTHEWGNDRAGAAEKGFVFSQTTVGIQTSGEVPASACPAGLAHHPNRFKLVKSTPEPVYLTLPLLESAGSIVIHAVSGTDVAPFDYTVTLEKKDGDAWVTAAEVTATFRSSIGTQCTLTNGQLFTLGDGHLSATGVEFRIKSTGDLWLRGIQATPYVP
jgi:hypothetical protein